MPPVSHCRWCRQAVNWLQHRSEQDAPSTEQTELQERNPSLHTRWVSALQVPSEPAREGAGSGLADGFEFVGLAGWAWTALKGRQSKRHKSGTNRDIAWSHPRGAAEARRRGRRDQPSCLTRRGPRPRRPLMPLPTVAAFAWGYDRFGSCARPVSSRPSCRYRQPSPKARNSSRGDLAENAGQGCE